MLWPAVYETPLVGVTVMGAVPPRISTGFTLAQLTVAVVPTADAASVHSVSAATPLAVLQRKNETANHAAETVPTSLVPSRVKVRLEPPLPFAPLRVPVSEVSSMRLALSESPPDTVKTTAIRVVSTAVRVAVADVPLARLVVPRCTVLPSASETTS